MTKINLKSAPYLVFIFRHPNTQEKLAIVGATFEEVQKTAESLNLYEDGWMYLDSEVGIPCF